MSQVRRYRILVANGVNLDLLGTREPETYGRASLEDLQRGLESRAKDLGSFVGLDFTLSFFQTNDEAELLQKISEAWDGILINPGAWTHTSLALADRFLGWGVPYVEVHISNISAREEIRKKSLTAGAARGVCYGMGLLSYETGLFALVNILKNSAIQGSDGSK